MDSAYDWGACWEFVQCPEAALPRVVVLVACCSACCFSTAVSPLVIVGAYGTSSLSSNYLIVRISWLITPTASSSYAWRLVIWAASTSVSSTIFSFAGLLGTSELEACKDVEMLAGWFCEWVFHGILSLLSVSVRMILACRDFVGKGLFKALLLAPNYRRVILYCQRLRLNDVD